MLVKLASFFPKSKLQTFPKLKFPYMSLVLKTAHRQTHKGGSTSAPQILSGETLFQGPLQ